VSGLGLRIIAAALAAAAAGLGVIAFLRMRPPPAPPAPPTLPSAVTTPPSGVASSPTSGSAEPAPPQAPEPALVSDDEPATLEEQRAVLMRRMASEMDLSEAAIDAVREVFDGSSVMGQGSPKVTVHPMKRSECRAVRAAAGLEDGGDPVCDARYMVPLFDPKAGETRAAARMCIDQFEFPGIPCEYPVTNARSREAALLCAAVGKRLCDAHEWEGACAGALHAPEHEYAFGQPRPLMTWTHNRHREVLWSYGPKKQHSKCATSGRKSKDCIDSGRKCGTNAWPAGAFPECVSSFGVFDLHGNVAEHMNLPLSREELAGEGGLGQTEMKGSWFIFSTIEAHEDDCRWRAKDWHPSTVMDPESHRNYHLGFRCCKDLAPR
jgi:formylglycine-generating enzyme